MRALAPAKILFACRKAIAVGMTRANCAGARNHAIILG